MDARQIIDYAAEDNAKDFRESLYASIYDKVNAHLEAKKQEIAQTLVTQESAGCATKADAKKIAKKEVKGHEHEMHEELSEYSLEEIEEYMQTEDFEQLDEISKDTLKSYVKKAAVDAGTDQLKMVRKHKKDTMKVGAPKEGPDWRNVGKQRQKGISKALDKLTKEEVEQIDEAPTRKHFQMVADLIKGHEDAGKRKELAQHHAEIFSKQNPRFDKEKFMKAAGA